MTTSIDDRPSAATPADDAIRQRVADRIRNWRTARPWRIEVDRGAVDLFGEPDDVRSMCELLAAVRVVPGVSAVHLYCGDATAASRARG